VNVLVIAPHPDDESIGCGGTIALHTGRGDRVVVVFLTSGELGLKHLGREQAWRVREREAEEAAEILEIGSTVFLRRPDWFLGEAIEETAVLLRTAMERESPRLVFLPHAREWHPDHRAALPIVALALNKALFPAPTLLTYEVWTPLQEYDRAEDITSMMRRKLHAVRCHRSQLAGFRYDRAVRGLNLYRGSLTIGCRFAEVFQVLPLPEIGSDPLR
jgi:LmbE family N-acetylglucosaminyl deacetylase